MWYNFFMNVITAPENVPDKADLFLGGGISNCPNWQENVISLLCDRDLTILNPRREMYSDGELAQKQIAWEYDALRKVSTVLFWFPSETLCPITLFELGVFTQRTDVRVLVGTHPEYARRFDVIEQLKHARPEIVVVDNLQDLVNQI